MTKTIRKTLLLLLSIWLLAGTAVSLEANRFKVIAQPEPNSFSAGSISYLKLLRTVRQIGNEDLEEFNSIKSVTVDKDRNFYIFDEIHKRIVKLDEEFKFSRYFGRTGEGPGEFKLGQYSRAVIHAGLDNRIYFVNMLKRRLIRFDRRGKFLDEFRFEQFRPFNVTVTGEGEIILPSINGYFLDVHDNNMKYRRSLVSGDLLDTFLFFKPLACILHVLRMPHDSTVKYALSRLEENRIILLNQVDLTVRKVNLKTGEIAETFRLWNDLVLRELKIKLARAFEKAAQVGGCGYSFPFISLFLGEEDQIYVQFVDSAGTPHIFKFSPDGRLLHTFLVDTHLIEDNPYFFAIFDGRFYAYNKFSLLVFKP